MRYTVKAAALATGISESRLRTWERRYGIPSPDRSDTGRRLYDDDDLALIRRMTAFVDAGLSAADAADAARSGEEMEPPAPLTHDEPVQVAEFAAAAERFDESRLLRALRSGIDQFGWQKAFDVVIFPALKRVGIYWETALFPPANEHFASELVRQEIGAAMRDLSAAPHDAPLVLLACPEDERHDIGLSALNLALRMAGLRTVYLGADVPTADLMSAYEATNPDAVCLSATSAIGLASLIRASRTILAARRIRLFIGGPAMSASGVEAAGVRLPPSIHEAAEALARALVSRGHNGSTVF